MKLISVEVALLLRFWIQSKEDFNINYSYFPALRGGIKSILIWFIIVPILDIVIEKIFFRYHTEPN
uniref:Uncharacterized protein n=1 Tax=Helianthus annuus TaxID=4232 RepID=A0A251S9T6_HELAN